MRFRRRKMKREKDEKYRNLQQSDHDKREKKDEGVEKGQEKRKEQQRDQKANLGKERLVTTHAAVNQHEQKRTREERPEG